MSGSDWRRTTAVLLGMFRRELPITVAIWLGVSVLLAVIGVISGDQTPAEAVTLALTFLPLAIPMAPLVWLRWERRARERSALPAVGLGCLWFLVTMPIAIGLAVLIGNWPGAE